jgi:hypothetical protein
MRGVLPLGAAGLAGGADQRIAPGLVVQVGEARPLAQAVVCDTG